MIYAPTDDNRRRLKPGRVLLRIGPLLIRRGNVYPQFIGCYWGEREIVGTTSGPGLMFNGDGKRDLFIAFYATTTHRLFVIMNGGRNLFKISTRRRS